MAHGWLLCAKTGRAPGNFPDQHPKRPPRTVTGIHPILSFFSPQAKAGQSCNSHAHLQLRESHNTEMAASTRRAEPDFTQGFGSFNFLPSKDCICSISDETSDDLSDISENQKTSTEPQRSK
jgi:hypothetical protein